MDQPAKPPLTRAEIQKAYRKRKKERMNEEEYEKHKEKESKRVMKYFVPVRKIGKKAAIKRREDNLKCVRRRRLIKNLTKNSNNVEEDEDDEDNNDGPCDSTTRVTRSKMIVKMPAIQIHMRTRPDNAKREAQKRRSSLKSNSAKINRLQKQNECKKVKIWRLEQRLKKVSGTASGKTPFTPSPTTASKPGPIYGQADTSSPVHDSATIASTSSSTPCLTPSSKAKSVLQSASKSRIKKKLTMFYAMMDDVKTSSSTEKVKKSRLNPASVVSGMVVKKYRLKSEMSRQLKQNRRCLSKGSLTAPKRKRLHALASEIKSLVVDFLSQDENSTCLPGKNDFKSTDEGKVQKRVLNDYMSNLYPKFRSSNPHINVSQATFCRLRPKNIQLASFNKRQSCLCQRHQNLSLKTLAIRRYVPTCPSNPEVFAAQSDEKIAEILNKIPNDTDVYYREWKRSEYEYKGKKAKKIKLIQSQNERKKFIDIVTKETKEFRSHVERIRHQYEQLRDLKLKLPKTHVICQMDFAENYTCSHADEIQSAYFAKPAVTLHPMVVYYRDDNDVLQHKSFLMTTDELAHKAFTVFAFMKRIQREIKQLVKDLKWIHYVTDSPTSQYRNKTVFYLIAHHAEMFNVHASWLYFEAGHGKSACDGVGGSSKRMAEEAVAMQKVSIQDADDYFTWGSASESKSVYIYVTKSECDEAQALIESFNTKPVPGTMSIHAVIPVGDGQISTRNVSCHCSGCFQIEFKENFCPSCEGWKNPEKQKLQTKNKNPEQIEKNLENDEQQDAPQHVQSFEVGAHVAATYSNNWYVGVVKDYDDSDDEYLITFLERVGSSFRPAKDENKETVWVPESSILCVVDAPKATGRSGRLLKLTDTDLDKVKKLAK